MTQIILASASPRRQELLGQIGLSFEVKVRPVDETLVEGLSPQEAVAELAYRKAREVAKTVDRGLVIGADTVVVHNNKILGKPVSCDDAVAALLALNGSSHLVITGFSVIDVETQKLVKESDTTEVKFRNLTRTEIEAYVKTGEPMDKAGSYGIQGLGAVLVEKINGCYFNVVGLPLTKLVLVLKEFGVEVLE